LILLAGDATNTITGVVDLSKRAAISQLQESSFMQLVHDRDAVDPNGSNALPMDL